MGSEHRMRGARLVACRDGGAEGCATPLAARGAPFALLTSVGFFQWYQRRWPRLPPRTVPRVFSAFAIRLKVPNAMSSHLATSLLNSSGEPWLVHSDGVWTVTEMMLRRISDTAQPVGPAASGVGTVAATCRQGAAVS